MSLTSNRAAPPASRSMCILFSPPLSSLTEILVLYKNKSSPWLWRNLWKMQNLSRDEFLEILGLTGGSFDQLQHAGHVALAFGTPTPATPGRYLDLDLVAMAINLGLTPSLGRENATTIVAGFFHQWASAVGYAEADPR